MNNSLYDAYVHLQVVCDRAKHNADELDRLRAENARLREALEKIHQYAIVMPVSRLSLEKRGVWEMAIEGAAMHVQKAARAVILAKGDE